MDRMISPYYVRNFVRHSVIEAPVSELFSWHLRDRAFERLTPPWLDVHVKGGPQRLEAGLNVELVARRFAVPMQMAFQVTEFKSDNKFVDQQVKGPFAYWRHEHIFEDLADGQSAMHDAIQFELPLAPASELFMGRFFDDDLLRMFRYRHEVLQMDLCGFMKNHRHPRRNVLIYSHLSGLTEPLWNFLATQGHSVTFVPESSKTYSEQERAEVKRNLDVGAYQVIFNLQNASQKGLLDLESRRVFVNALAKLEKPFDLYVEVIDSQPSGHLIDQWEELCAPLRSNSTRCVLATHSAILTPAFGVLKNNWSWKNGTKPWIAVDDVVAAIEHCMLYETIDGHADLSASHAVGATKGSKQLTDTGYQFRYPTLDSALKHVLGA